MTRPGEHLTDEQLSASVDQGRAAEADLAAQTHLAGCAACQQRLSELQSLVALLRALPSEEPPRDFQLPLRPRLVVVEDPPNVTRLRRWYAVTRVGAASLAAAFVFLSVAALYLDGRSSPSSTTNLAQPEVASAPAAAGQSASAAASAATAPVRPAASAAAPPAAPAAAAPAAAARSQAAPPPAAQPVGADAADQTAAATSVQPLPAQLPTAVKSAPAPLQTAAAPTAVQRGRDPEPEPAVPLRVAAAVAGLLAVLGLAGALFIRHRLTAAHLATE